MHDLQRHQFPPGTLRSTRVTGTYQRHQDPPEKPRSSMDTWIHWGPWEKQGSTRDTGIPWWNFSVYQRQKNSPKTMGSTGDTWIHKGHHGPRGILGSTKDTQIHQRHHNKPGTPENVREQWKLSWTLKSSRCSKANKLWKTPRSTWDNEIWQGYCSFQGYQDLQKSWIYQGHWHPQRTVVSTRDTRVLQGHWDPTGTLETTRDTRAFQGHFDLPRCYNPLDTGFPQGLQSPQETLCSNRNTGIH